MEFQLRDGDYIPDGRGGVKTLEGAQEVLQRVLFRLQARRGGMPLLPRLGSGLYRLDREKPSARRAVAEWYVLEALEDEKDVSVTSVELSGLDEGRSQLTVRLDWRGQPLTAQMEL